MPNVVSRKFAAVFPEDSGSEGEVQQADRTRSHAPATSVRVDLDLQCLELHVQGNLERTYPVSTAANGPGERDGSHCTPRGRHTIRAKIGAGAAPDTVFVARRPTGERYTRELRATYPDRDWILTRILWLSGLEPGRNRLGSVDTMQAIHLHPRLSRRCRHHDSRLPRLHPHAKR